MILEEPQFLAGLSLWYLLSLAAWIAALVWGVRRLLYARRTSHGQPSRMRWINAGLSLWMLLAGLTAVEGYFALFYDQSDSFNMTNVSDRWFKRHVRTNVAGFRDDRPLDKTAPPGVYRLWFIGDSFTFGHGVNNPADRFSDRVGAALDRQHPGRFSVSNIAEAGISIAHVENLIKKSLEMDYEFDTVVYVICLNDIEPYVESNGERYSKMGKLRAPFLIRDTYFFNLLWFRLKAAMQPQVRNYYSDLADAYREGEPLTRFLYTLDELHSLCVRHKIELRIAIFPFLHNLGPDYPFAAAHKVLIDHCRRQEIPVLDLAPALEPHLSEGLMVNRFDAHPNERAHQLAAEAILNDLLSDLTKSP
ncbi:MAG: SGNH/GDSL hydrolase family protein [Planctomycetia bacterium]|nr:SGNH/GDSL hydrolase family protein [Planctomycetia bacterium]